MNFTACPQYPVGLDLYYVFDKVTVAHDTVGRLVIVKFTRHISVLAFAMPPQILVGLWGSETGIPRYS